MHKEPEMMIHATLKRTSSDDSTTFGELYIVDERICHTLEPPWRDNQENISCIPAGTYIVKRHVSSRFGKVWELQDVEGRTRIYIHRGNIVRHTKGCILVGMMKGNIVRHTKGRILVGMMKGDLRSVPAVLDSRGAWEKLNELFGDEDFKLTITEGE
jgi:hypothetical protein